MSFCCHNCKSVTRSIEPFLVKRMKKDDYHVLAKCAVCHSIKSRFMKRIHNYIELPLPSPPYTIGHRYYEEYKGIKIYDILKNIELK